jgi:hypothetical protein
MVRLIGRSNARRAWLLGQILWIVPQINQPGGRPSPVDFATGSRPNVLNDRGGDMAPSPAVAPAKKRTLDCPNKKMANVSDRSHCDAGAVRH